MKALRFAEFYQGKYKDIGYELYFIKDSGGKALYIGISGDSIWHRWFGAETSHFTIVENGGVCGTSHIGQVIERNFPASWNWTIELWTKDDCQKALSKEKNSAIKDLEESMIAKFNPVYNVMHGGGYHEDPLDRKRLDDEYRKIFG